jgi:uncharacterized protein YndB with AHSA1/START domain
MKTTEISVSRTIAAPAEEVFDLMIDPERNGWLWSCADRVIWNPAPETLFYIALHRKGKNWSHYGRFLRVERPGLLEHTWVSEGSKGLESVVTITLEPRGEQTEVTLRHSGVPDEEGGRHHSDSWSWLLSEFSEGFASRQAALP